MAKLCENNVAYFFMGHGVVHSVMVRSETHDFTKLLRKPSWRKIGKLARPGWEFCTKTDRGWGIKLLRPGLGQQEAQLPLRNRASATYFFVAKLISVAHSCL